MYRERASAAKNFCFPKGVTPSFITTLPKVPLIDDSRNIERLRDQNFFMFTLIGIPINGKPINPKNETGWIYCYCFRLLSETGIVLFCIRIGNRQ